jgi:hypothetical protein
MLLAESDGLGVVIPMHVGHKESLDILGPTLKGGKASHEALPGLWQRPSGVDAHEAALALQEVHIDSTQRVVRQRQRYSKDILHDFDDAGFHPFI